MNTDSKTISIPDQINQDYRKYALYVIQSRGIPNFYDCLTPVQRIILEKSPTSFHKTIGIVGEVFKTGRYHHGDLSLSKAISKLARTFGCSDLVLDGDGFFGSTVNPSPAAARYTSIKISNRYKSIIDQYKDLNEENEEGSFDWLHVTFPIGLVTHIVGIAVGYRSNILPRKYEDVLAYINGDKERKIKPHFRGFKGKISRVDSLKSAWLIEGVCQVDLKARTILINNLSPLVRFDTLNTKLYKILEASNLDYKLENKSKDDIEFGIKLKCTDEQFNWISDRIKKETQHIVTENIVIVKDGGVIEYTTVEEYLDQFIVHKENVLLKRIIRDEFYNNKEIYFNEVKLKFLIFMLEKKRNEEQINEFLKQYDQKIQNRLETISATKLSTTEVEATKNKIKEYKDKSNEIKRLIKEQENKYNTALNLWNQVSKKKLKQSSLMSDDSTSEGSYNGIQIWNPEEYLNDEFSEETENDTDEETNEE